MKSEQLADNVTLYCGDAREVIPTLKGISAVITDAPYGTEELVIGYGRRQQVEGKSKKDYLLIANDKNLNVTGEVFALLRKQLRNAWLVSFYSCRVSPKFFKMMEGYEYFNEMVWDKKVPGMGSQIRLQHENIAFFKVGKPSDLKDTMSVMTFMPVKGKDKGIHPHEKPHQVMVNLVDMVPGQTILDPFCGTGSTGAAAVQLKRGFVGIEIDPKHFEAAIRKVTAAIKQPMLWE